MGRVSAAYLLLNESFNVLDAARRISGNKARWWDNTESKHLHLTPTRHLTFIRLRDYVNRALLLQLLHSTPTSAPQPPAIIQQLPCILAELQSKGVHLIKIDVHRSSASSVDVN